MGLRLPRLVTHKTKVLPSVTIEDAAAALALFSPSPDFPIIVKREPSRLLDVNGWEYKKLFFEARSGRQVGNAVIFYRKALQIMRENESHATGLEKLFYRHGRYGIIWLVFQENSTWLQKNEIADEAQAGAELSARLGDTDGKH